MGRTTQTLARFPKSDLAEGNHENYWDPSKSTIIGIVADDNRVLVVTSSGHVELKDDSFGAVQRVRDFRHPNLMSVGIGQDVVTVLPRGEDFLRVSSLQFSCIEGSDNFGNARYTHNALHVLYIQPLLSTCKKAFIHGPYLVAICEELIEIHETERGRLVQIIEGEDINAWPSYGMAAPQFVKKKDSGFVLSLRNPKDRKTTLILDATLVSNTL